MPVVHRSNNRILPANTRAVDVAQRTIRDLTPVQQLRYANAFKVQGYEAIVYNRLRQGLPCSCQARRGTLTTLLNEEGKMDEGTMNELLTGGLEFTVNRYGSTSKPNSDVSRANTRRPLERTDQSRGDLRNPNQTPFPVNGPARAIDDPYIDVTADDGVAGPNQPIDLDDVVETFDGELVDFQGTSCTCCYGTGFVGGFAVLGGYRKVIAPNSPEVTKLVEGTIEVNRYPNEFRARQVEMLVTLPLGYVALDSFRVWQNKTQVQTATLTLDDLPYSPQLFAALCDGRPHKIVVSFPEATYWSHLEIQVAISTDPAYIEFPRLQQGSDISLQDLTDSVQINASPLIPRLTTQDVIVESTFGKTFVISSSNWWNDKDRNVHGWDCQARVIQPSELLSFLPRRRQLKQKATHPVRDNIDGIRRT